MSTTATTPRRFEFIGGNSRKFWEVRVQGNDVCVRFGRIGSDGQTSFKSLASPEAAAAHAAKLVQEKTGKGCVAVA
jgi:predicted DNA-binding WGR domain protein